MQQLVTDCPDVVHLADPRAVQPGLTGAKAASLARAANAGLPVVEGFVLTTGFDPDSPHAAWQAWSSLSADGAETLVVRSSSTAEDGEVSSMAGLFTSVLDVRGRDATEDAVREVLGSRLRSGLVDAPMAVLVQRQVTARWGGVVFGADPVTGRTDRLVVAAVAGGPDELVSGRVDGWTATSSRRGRVDEVRQDSGPRPPADVLRRLASLAADAGRVFGGPQDIEWAVDAQDQLHLLQSRPITTLHGPVTGPVLGAAPLAESFPDPLTELEHDLWIEPLRQGLREALTLTAAAPARAIGRSPVVVDIGGYAVADLELLGATSRRRGFFARLDPRPPARRLRASWRVGRLTAALPALARDIVEQVDADLAAVPGVGELSNSDLLAVLANARAYLAGLTGHEALAGLLLTPGAEAVTAASVALAALGEGATEGVPADELDATNPVVLALVPPSTGAGTRLPGAGSPPASVPPTDADPIAVAREALRLRIRWVQELTAVVVQELGRRLAAVGVLPSAESARLLRLDELVTAAERRGLPDDLADRAVPAPRSLPTEFRLAADGHPVANATRPGAAVGAGGGRGRGPAWFDEDPPAGAVLVVQHLDPRLADVIPRLAGLVAETGNPLSHLAILAREHGVPTVVSVAGARTRWSAGDVLDVDGDAGAVVINGGTS